MYKPLALAAAFGILASTGLSAQEIDTEINTPAPVTSTAADDCVTGFVDGVLNQYEAYTFTPGVQTTLGYDFDKTVADCERSTGTPVNDFKGMTNMSVTVGSFTVELN